MKFRWTGITETEYERLVARCNFTLVEHEILKMRRKSIALDVIADKIGYSQRQMHNISNIVIEKILKES